MSELGSQKKRLSVVGCSIVIYVILSIAAPFQSARVVDFIWQNLKSGGSFSLDQNNLRGNLIVLTLLYVFQWLFYYLQSFLMASVAENLILSLRQKVSGKLNKLPLNFFDQNKAGELLSKVTNDLDKVSETLQTGLLKLLVAIGTVTGSLLVMIYYSWQLTAIFLIFMVASMVITRIVAGKNLKLASLRQESIGELTGVVEEYYTGRNIIKAYTAESDSQAKVEIFTKKNQDISQKADFLTNCMNPLIRFLTRLAHVIIAVIAGIAIVNGTMTVGVVQAFFQYINQTAEPLTQASYMINTLQAALASAERIFILLDSPEEIPDTAHPLHLENCRGEVAFSHVSFGYTPERQLMKNINFTAKPGKKMAVVGSTGAGKTTLINLLMRFYEVNSGEISVDGIPITALTRQELRDNVGMVLQDTWLFSGTIAENIKYGKDDATMAEIVAAAKAAKADHFIKTLSAGYETIISNEGANLSVGERQLITIARVFLCNPAILILDEATSSVDTRTEMEISKAMTSLMESRTSFVIAHRLSTIRDADTILFMEHGDIIEQGSHEELLAQNGGYAALYLSQFA